MIDHHTLKKYGKYGKCVFAAPAGYCKLTAVNSKNKNKDIRILTGLGPNFWLWVTVYMHCCILALVTVLEDIRSQ